MGPSGSGKSTLLHCLAGIVPPDAGHGPLRRRGPVGDVRRERSALRRTRLRVRLPVRPARARADLPGERRAAAAARRRRGARRRERAASCWTGSRSPTSRRSGPARSPAARASASRSPAPWSPGRAWCSPTSRPARWTRSTASRSCSCSPRPRGARTAVVLVTHEARVAAYADREVVVRDGRTPRPRAGRPMIARAAARRAACRRRRSRAALLRTGLTALGVGARGGRAAASRRRCPTITVRSEPCAARATPVFGRSRQRPTPLLRELDTRSAPHDGPRPRCAARGRPPRRCHRARRVPRTGELFVSPELRDLLASDGRAAAARAPARARRRRDRPRRAAGPHELAFYTGADDLPRGAPWATHRPLRRRSASAPASTRP